MPCFQNMSNIKENSNIISIPHNPRMHIDIIFLKMIPKHNGMHSPTQCKPKSMKIQQNRLIIMLIVFVMNHAQ